MPKPLLLILTIYQMHNDFSNIILKGGISVLEAEFCFTVKMQMNVQGDRKWIRDSRKIEME